MKNASLTVDLDAILYNFRHIKCNYNKNIIAILKDDAYGLGLINVANTLKYEPNVIFAVSSIDEIIKLRDNDINNEILYLNVFDEQDLEIIKKYNVSVIVQSFKQLTLLKESNIKFHLKFNCNMNRLGLYDYEIDKTIKEINSNSNSYNLVGLMTHLANEDCDLSAYNKFKQLVKKVNKNNLIIHCFSSSSLKNIKDDISNYVRVGIKLYGIGDRNMFLENVVYINSPILQIKKVKENECVGYDHLFKTPTDGYLYFLPLGYGKGWGDFNFSCFYNEGTFIKQAGKISMDYSTYFSSYLLDENINVELIGKHISIEQLCKVNNIKPHELLVRLKLPIKYIKKAI